MRRGSVGEPGDVDHGIFITGRAEESTPSRVESEEREVVVPRGGGGYCWGTSEGDRHNPAEKVVDRIHGDMDTFEAEGIGILVAQFKDAVVCSRIDSQFATSDSR